MATFPEALSGYDAGTPANNTPAGSDSVGAQLDDHLRDIKANIKNAGALTPSSTATAAVTMVAADFNKLLLVDPSAAARTVSVLTAAAALAGFRVGIKNVSGANNVIVHRSGSDTIDGEASITLSATNQAVMLACNGSTWYRTSTHTPPPPTSASVVVFTSGVSTWTKPANFLYAIIEVQGGGGGGGGTANPSSTSSGAGTGGGAGGYARKLLLTAALGSTETVTVGAAVAGGSSSDGTDGNASTFAVAAGTDIVGNGGKGGNSQASPVGTIAREIGAAGGTATGGDINMTGSGSEGSWQIGNTIFGTGQALAVASSGGAAYFGGSPLARGQESGEAHGADGAQGSGGSGGTSGDTGGAATGGDGGAGLVVVTQYLSA